MSWLSKIGSTEIRNILSVIIVIGAFSVLTLIIFKPIPEVNKDVVNIAIGLVLGGPVGGVIGYYFAASKKDEPKV